MTISSGFQLSRRRQINASDAADLQPDPPAQTKAMTEGEVLTDAHACIEVTADAEVFPSTGEERF